MKAEFAVGIRARLPLSAVKVEEIRFGIPKVLHDATSGELFVELIDRKPDAKTIIRLDKADHSETVDLRCETYFAAAVFPDLPDEFRLSRFVDRLFSAIMGMGPSPDVPAGHWRMSFNWVFSVPADDELVPLEDLGTAARAALLIHDSQIAPIRMKVSSDNGASFARTDTKANAGFNPQTLHYWTVMDRAHRLAARHRLVAGISVRPESLVGQAEALEFLTSCISGAGNCARFGADVAIAEPAEAEQAAMIVAPYVRIGDHYIGFCVGLIGKPSWSARSPASQHLEVADAGMRVFREFCVPADAWEDFDLLDTFAAARKALQDEGISLVICPDKEESVEAA